MLNVQIYEIWLYFKLKFTPKQSDFIRFFTAIEQSTIVSVHSCQPCSTKRAIFCLHSVPCFIVQQRTTLGLQNNKMQFYLMCNEWMQQHLDSAHFKNSFPSLQHTNQFCMLGITQNISFVWNVVLSKTGELSFKAKTVKCIDFAVCFAHRRSKTNWISKSKTWQRMHKI